MNTQKVESHHFPNSLVPLRATQVLVDGKFTMPALFSLISPGSCKSRLSVVIVYIVVIGVARGVRSDNQWFRQGRKSWQMMTLSFQ